VLFSIRRRVATRCDKLTRNMHTTAGTWRAYRQGRGGYLRRGVQLQHTATHSHGTFIPQQVLCGLLGKGEDAIFDEAQNVAMFGRGAELENNATDTHTKHAYHGRYLEGLSARARVPFSTRRIRVAAVTHFVALAMGMRDASPGAMLPLRSTIMLLVACPTINCRHTYTRMFTNDTHARHSCIHICKHTYIEQHTTHFVACRRVSQYHLSSPMNTSLQTDTHKHACKHTRMHMCNKMHFDAHRRVPHHDLSSLFHTFTHINTHESL